MIEGVPEGRYLVSARSADLSAAPIEVALSGGETGAVELALRFTAIRESVVVSAALGARREEESGTFVDSLSADALRDRDEWFLLEGPARNARHAGLSDRQPGTAARPPLPGTAGPGHRRRGGRGAAPGCRGAPVGCDRAAAVAGRARGGPRGDPARRRLDHLWLERDGRGAPHRHPVGVRSRRAAVFRRPRGARPLGGERRSGRRRPARRRLRRLQPARGERGRGRGRPVHEPHRRRARRIPPDRLPAGDRALALFAGHGGSERESVPARAGRTRGHGGRAGSGSGGPRLRGGNPARESGPRGRQLHAVRERSRQQPGDEVRFDAGCAAGVGRPGSRLERTAPRPADPSRERGRAGRREPVRPPFAVHPDLRGGGAKRRRPGRAVPRTGPRGHRRGVRSRAGGDHRPRLRDPASPDQHRRVRAGGGGHRRRTGGPARRPAGPAFLDGGAGTGARRGEPVAGRRAAAGGGRRHR